jgi:hypothetical protein
MPLIKLLVDSCSHFICLFLALEHCVCQFCLATSEVELTERQLLESSAGRLGKDQIDKRHLESQPAAIHQQPPPADILQADWVHIGCKEARASAVELEPRDTSGATKVGEDFDQVG